MFDLADEFNRFKDKHGNFDVGITNDARGLLSLYNAAHLFTHGEAELEEAILFARQHLESMRNNLEYPLAQQVNRALLVPLPRTVRRLEALHYISEYKESPAHDPSLLEFAQLDFDLLQRLHLKELKALSRYNQYLAIRIMKREVLTILGLNNNPLMSRANIAMTDYVDMGAQVQPIGPSVNTTHRYCSAGTVAHTVGHCKIY